MVDLLGVCITSPYILLAASQGLQICSVSIQNYQNSSTVPLLTVPNGYYCTTKIQNSVNRFAYRWTCDPALHDWTRSSHRIPGMFIHLKAGTYSCGDTARVSYMPENCTAKISSSNKCKTQ